jgi:hypothetical protein
VLIRWVPSLERETVAAWHAKASLEPVLDRRFRVVLHAGRRVHTWFAGAPRSLADLGPDRIASAIGSAEGRGGREDP